MNQYIGITDFASYDQVERMLEVFKLSCSKEMSFKLHVGVMMSYGTLQGKSKKHQNVFPKKEIVADIFSSRETYNCLHYVDSIERDINYLGRANLENYLFKAIFYGGADIHALQLDMNWPDPLEISKALERSQKKLKLFYKLEKSLLIKLVIVRYRW